MKITTIIIVLQSDREYWCEHSFTKTVKKESIALMLIIIFWKLFFDMWEIKKKEKSGKNACDSNKNWNVFSMVLMFGVAAYTWEFLYHYLHCRQRKTMLQMCTLDINICFLLSCRTSILGISFGAAFLLLAFILFICFAGQLLVGIKGIQSRS